jgi:hypothetical protein
MSWAIRHPATRPAVVATRGTSPWSSPVVPRTRSGHAPAHTRARGRRAGLVGVAGGWHRWRGSAPFGRVLMERSVWAVRVVKSVRDAVPVFRPARFPGPLPEPAVRLSPQRALRKSQVGLTDSLVQLGLDLQYPSFRERGFRIAGIHPSLLIFHGRPLLTYWAPSPCAELSSARTTTGPVCQAPSLGPGSATDLPITGLGARWEGDRGMVPTFTS